MADNTAGRIGEDTMTALFRDRADAERAVQALLDRGYSRDEVNVVMSEETRSRHYATGGTGDTHMGDKAAEGTGVGSAIGGTVGAVLAAIAAIGTSVALPGLGLIVAGPLAAALAGAGAGGITGGLVGALVGSGIPEESAREYEAGIRAGGVVLNFRPRSRQEADEVAAVWRRYNGESLHG